MQNNSKKLILIVDDSKDNLELLTIVLRSNGFSVHCASNGEEALAILLELSILPDLILLDARMPVMDGYQFRDVQSKNERIRHIPVLVMTGDNSENMNVNMKNPRGILIKPLGINKVIDTVSTCI